MKRKPTLAKLPPTTKRATKIIYRCTKCNFNTRHPARLTQHITNSEGNKEQANNESKEITNLILQHYETDYSTGELRKYGEAKVCTLRQSLHMKIMHGIYRIR